MPLPNLRRGLAAHVTDLMGDEGRDEFLQFRERMFGELGPSGPEETALAEVIVSEYWNLKRVPAIEAGILTVSSNVAADLAELSLYELRLTRVLNESRASLLGVQAARRAS